MIWVKQCHKPAICGDLRDFPAFWSATARISRRNFSASFWAILAKMPRETMVGESKYF